MLPVLATGSLLGAREDRLKGEKGAPGPACVWSRGSGGRDYPRNCCSLWSVNKNRPGITQTCELPWLGLKPIWVRSFVLFGCCKPLAKSRASRQASNTCMQTHSFLIALYPVA